MKAIWRGQVIAESDRTLEVGGYRYFPRETVRMDLLLGTILHSVSQRSRLAKPET